MCLMLYLASDHDLALREESHLRIQNVDTDRDAIRQWLSHPHVRYIGAHKVCGCGFPHVIADEPVEYHDGIFDEDDPARADDVRSVRALFGIIAECLRHSDAVELLPVWVGNEGDRPLGGLALSLSEQDPAEFLFTEAFLYRITE